MGCLERQMDEKHSRRPPDRACAVAAAADIIGKEHFSDAPTMRRSVTHLYFNGAGKHDHQLPP
jgi:hypothetical protein